VPFIARYRKEATEGLDDSELRELESRLAYLRELEERRAAVLKRIAEQGKLTPALQAAIEVAPTKQALEDLYLPDKVKRRTKGLIALRPGWSRWPTGCLPTRCWTRTPRPWRLSPVARAARPSWPKPALPTRLRCWTVCAICPASAGPRSVSDATSEQDVG